jgi:glycosyltransferase involved in cell wall biosynthesis
MPAYNRAHCIMDSIKSVLAQDTSVFNWELIVCDDASTDGTQALFAKSTDKRIKYFRLAKNGGVNVARNCAIKRARGEYILFLDSDDFLVGNAFSILAHYLPSSHKILLFSTQNVESKQRMTTVSHEGIYTYSKWLESREIGGEFLSIVHKSVVALDLFDEERFCFEAFFWNRIVKKYGVFASPIVLREYSFDSGNRVSAKLSDPKYAAQRFSDYKNYISTFEKDFIDCKLFGQLSRLYVRTAVFAMLGNNYSEARLFVKKSFSYKMTLLGLVVYKSTFLPYFMVAFLYKIVRLVIK